MPLIVIDQEKDLDAVLSRVLTSRASKGAREQAADAIRAANPGLDLNALSPGATLVVPTFTDSRSANGDVMGGTLDDLAAALQRGLDDLAAASEAAAQMNKDELDQAAEAFRSADITRAAANDPQLAGVLNGLKESLDDDARAGERQIGAINDALQQWKADLGALRGRP